MCRRMQGSKGNTVAAVRSPQNWGVGLSIVVDPEPWHQESTASTRALSMVYAKAA